VRLLPESGQVLLAAAILSASIIVRPAQPVIADPRPGETVIVEQQPLVVNVEPPVVQLEPPVVNVEITVPNAQLEPTTVIVEPAPVLPAEIIYEDRVVEVERIVEIPSCLDYSDLPYFDLANALTQAFPGALWSLNGSHYPGLVWHDDSEMPDMSAIIGGWLAHLSKDC